MLLFPEFRLAPPLTERAQHHQYRCVFCFVFFTQVELDIFSTCNFVHIVNQCGNQALLYLIALFLATSTVNSCHFLHTVMSVFLQCLWLRRLLHLTGISQSPTNLAYLTGFHLSGPWLQLDLLHKAV